jgi:anti-sigma factor RsiW
LIGGRLDYLDNRPVAALIYLLHWVEGDFNYWAVSDVNKEDLQNFQHIFEEQVVAH